MNITKIMKISAAVMFGSLVLLFLIFRHWYSDKEPITANEFSVYGITNGIGIECGETLERVSVSVPESIEAAEIISVSSAPDVAYLRLNKENMGDDRVIMAEVIALSPGIAELYVRSGDGDVVSKKYSVNIISTAETQIIVDVTTSVTENAELTDGNVYVTPTGSKYHLKHSCAGDTAFQITLEEAVHKGYLPCKTCAKSK